MVLVANIDLEAQENSKIPSDIDNFRFRYVDIDNEEDISVFYPGFEITTLEQNLYDLLSDSDFVEWKSSWRYRPDYVSYEYYGTVVYWYVILYVNQVDSLLDFVDLRNVIVPSIRSVKNLTSERINEQYIQNTEIEIDQLTRFYKRYPLDTLENSTISSKEELDVGDTSTPEDCELRELEQSFTLTSTDISNKYVDLQYEPVNYSSLKFEIDGFTSVRSYGYDYVLIYVPGSDDKIRISWSSSDCPFGNGLDHILREDDTIEITYVYAQVGCDPCPVVDDDILDGGIYGDD